MIEIWREILEFPEYEVSNTGFVRNKKTKRVLKGYLNRPGGYLKVNINGQRLYVHRLVFETFGRYLRENERVMFYDKNHENTCINNLYVAEKGYGYIDDLWEDFY